MKINLKGSTRIVFMFNKVIVKMRLGGATNQSFSNIKRQNFEILNAWKNNNLDVPFLLMPLRIIKRFIQFF